MNRKIIVVGAIVGTMLSGLAENFYLRSGTSDWSQTASFAMNAALTTDASRLPAATDDVYLPDGDVSLTSGTASFSTAAAVGRIVPKATTRLMLTVDDDATFNAKINNGVTQEVLDPNAGTVVKYGDGVLTLTATSSIPGNANLDFSYYVSFDIEAGTLVLPQTGNAIHRYYGDITVAANATQQLAACTSKEAYTRMRSLCGEGTIRGGDIADNTRRQYVYTMEVTDAKRRASVFGGRIEGQYTYIWATGNLTLTNPESSFGLMVTVQSNKGHLSGGTNGIISTTSFGRYGQPSPLGKYGYLTFGSNGAGYRYLGTTDETVDKTLYFSNNDDNTKAADLFIDAGAHGGLTFTGQWQNKSESVKNVHLLGSNTVPCIVSNTWSVSSENGYPIFITKGGTGTWMVTANRAANRDIRGGVAVEDGVLRFASISNIGEKCDLGSATFLTRPMTGIPVESDMRVYAHTIGNTKEDANAVFEYVGGQCAIATNRPTVLVGKGTVRSMATGKGYLALTDISPRDAAAVTLVLDGTNGNHNLMRDIHDGTGVVSVVKRGSGEWTLSGDTRFSGSLRVEEGVLTVLGPRYTWFRMSVMQAGDGAADNMGDDRGQIAMQKIALYDAEGVRQNVGLQCTPAYGSGKHPADAAWQELTPGSAKTGRPGVRQYTAEHDVAELFQETDGVSVTIQYRNANDTDWIISSTNDPSTWISYVMRLTNGVPEIVRYDIQAWYNNSIARRWPRHVRMEGSRDGVKWDWLGDHDFDPEGRTTSGRWISNGDSFSPGAVRKGKGMALTHSSDPDAFVLSNVTYVAVSSGAVLRTFDDVTLSSIEVDYNDCGTIQGFTLAAEGELNIRNLPAETRCDLPLILSGVVGTENLENWNVSLNGIPRSKVKLHVSGSTVSVTRPGFCMTIK